jgi:hypothetical protein
MAGRRHSLRTTASTRARRLQRLAQRACGQAPAIQYTARIEHGNFDVARQSIVLQSIVAEDYVAVGMKPQSTPVPRRRGLHHEYRTSAVSGKHQCLVAENGRIAGRIDRRGPRTLPR